MALRIAVVTVSDRSFNKQRPDASGPTLTALCVSRGFDVVAEALVPDDRGRIASMLRWLADEQRAEVVLTTGGTGIGRRDVTPEATRDVLDRELPAMTLALANESLKHTPMAMLSRAVAGTRNTTLIVNFPGGVKAVGECFAVVAPVLDHAVALLRDEDPHRLPATPEPTGSPRPTAVR
jgi:molybdenum cofactor synthesis domain-containing protein